MLGLADSLTNYFFASLQLDSDILLGWWVQELGVRSQSRMMEVKNDVHL